MQTTTMTQLTTVITLGLSFLIACSSHNRDSPDAATIAHVSLKVSGMMQRGGILWLGWPDTIVKALEELKGIEKAEYKVADEVFSIAYDKKRLAPAQIMEKIRQVGEKGGLLYEPQVVKPMNAPIKLELKP